MSVVLRCPSCGTTRATRGECEACHEAQVRLFCTSHEPGLWLDGSTCPTCEARLREAVATPARVPVLRETRERPPAVDEDVLERAAPPAALLGRLLQAALLARLSPAAPRVERERMPIGRAVGGCLTRLLLLALFLIAAIAGGLYLFGRSALQ